MDNDPLPERPEPQFEDRTMQAAKIALTAIPFGGTAAELFEAIFRPPLSKRRDKWFDLLADAIRKLQDKVDGLDLESLQSDETFVTVMTHATQVAYRNHQKEKLHALRNAVLNSKLPNSPDEDTQLIFLELIDRLTPSHIRILTLFDDPKAHTEEKGISYDNVISGSVGRLIEDIFPELQGQRDFYNQVVRDLHAAGLSGVDHTGGMISGSGMLGRRTTAWGQEFIRFISSPPQLASSE